MEQSSQKKRAVVSYENMSEELAAAFAEKYPKGFTDYLPISLLLSKLLDLLREHRADVASLHLQGGRQFARIHREVAFQDRELLNPTPSLQSPIPYFCALLNADMLYC